MRPITRRNRSEVAFSFVKKMIQKIRRIFWGVALVAVAGCGAPPPPPEASDVTRLAVGIGALGPEVDPEEARRAAQVAYSYSHQLAQDYQITDPPIIHNTKVNMGLKPRGLCWHWARDIEARLKQENFQTLELHRAVANSDNVFRLEHSTAVISRRGDTFAQGIVLDPWRKGGTLTWMRTTDDRWYNWEPRNEVVARQLERKHGQIVTVTKDQRIVMGQTEFRAQ